MMLGKRRSRDLNPLRHWQHWTCQWRDHLENRDLRSRTVAADALMAADPTGATLSATRHGDASNASLKSKRQSRSGNGSNSFSLSRFG
eukprot:132698-Rhodomonas_salina.1